MQVLLSVLQERRERRALDVEEAAVAAAATAAAQSSQHNSAKGQWDFAQRVQRAVQSEEEASLASIRPARRAQHQRHGSGSDKEGPSHTHRRPTEVMVLMLATNICQSGAFDGNTTSGYNQKSTVTNGVVATVMPYPSTCHTQAKTEATLDCRTC